MSFKSVFDSYLDRRAQSAQQEVEFARAVSQARQTAAAEDRARSALNVGIAEYNNKLPGLARRNAIEEATMPFLLQNLGYNKAIGEQNSQIALRSAAAKNALIIGDYAGYERVTGEKVRNNPTSGIREFSRDGGANWFLQSGVDSDTAAKQRTALNAGLDDQMAQLDFNKTLRDRQLADEAAKRAGTAPPTAALPYGEPINSPGSFGRFDKLIDPYANQKVATPPGTFENGFKASPASPAPMPTATPVQKPVPQSAPSQAATPSQPVMASAPTEYDSYVAALRALDEKMREVGASAASMQAGDQVKASNLITQLAQQRMDTIRKAQAKGIFLQ